MASGDSRFEQQNQLDEKEEQRLKYLEFVHVAGIYTMMCFWSLYLYAKDKSGPLKPSVEAVESTVKTVVGPVYHKFHDFPIEVLKFVDRKMDESMNKLDHHVPPVVRQVSTKAYSAAQKAPELARNVASGVQRTSVVDTASGIAKSMYAKYEPVAEQYAVSAWCSFKKLPVFPQVAQVMAPTAAYCSEKYNRTVLSTAEKGYKVANLLPLVPTEKITEVFRTPEAEFHPLDAQQVDPTVAAH